MGQRGQATSGRGAGRILAASLLLAAALVAAAGEASAQYPDVPGQPVTFGDAGYFGSTGGAPLNKPVVGMAAAPDGGGYWLVASDGGVFNFGDARFFGSTGGAPLNKPVVGMAVTPDGGGYWLVASDGGVFNFGDAGFFGSMGGSHLNAPVVGMVADAATGGYWLVAADGGVFSFNAPFFGSMGGSHLNAPVVGMATNKGGSGYWLAARDGGVFTLGGVPFFGSMGAQANTNPITVIVATPDGGGYWLLPTVAPPPPSWAVPGTVIRNLDSAPGSPFPSGRRVVALTFDDGPSPVYTPQILRILTSSGSPASFSIVGRYGAAYPSLLSQEVAAGMALVNHTWSHVDLATLPLSQWGYQVDQTDALLAGATGHPVRCLRPPYGDTNSTVLSQLGGRGLAELMWDIDPSDYQMPGASIIAHRVLSALHPGAVILLHDGGGDRSQTVAALPTIINGIRSAGYQIVPVCAG